MSQFNISSPDQMFQLGKDLAKINNKWLVVGDLGAGKTILAKGFADSLGINKDEIQSPTYTYIHSHGQNFLHGDFYRFTSKDTLYTHGILEEIERHEYVFIERPYFAADFSDKSRGAIIIQKIDSDNRLVKLVNYDEILKMLVK